MATAVDIWLTPFALDPHLHAQAAAVIGALPAGVQIDLMDDPEFCLSDYEPHRGLCVRVGSPSARRPGRAVALKRTLREHPETFIRYVIAHELAHAYLRNQGRTDGEDPETAADALAADWGFPRPTVWPFPVRPGR